MEEKIGLDINALVSATDAAVSERMKAFRPGRGVQRIPLNEAVMDAAYASKGLKDYIEHMAEGTVQAVQAAMPIAPLPLVMSRFGVLMFEIGVVSGFAFKAGQELEELIKPKGGRHAVAKNRKRRGTRQAGTPADGGFDETQRDG